MTDEERRWTDENIDAVAQKHFPNVDVATALQRPILYSCWLTKDYLPVDREVLRDYVKARLKVSTRRYLNVVMVFVTYPTLLGAFMFWNHICTMRR